METRAKRRRTLRVRFLDLPEEVFAIILEFHPDRADPDDDVVSELSRLAGRYANPRSTTTTETVSVDRYDRPVHEVKTITTQNYRLHSLDGRPAVVVLQRFLPIDVRYFGPPIRTVAEFEVELERVNNGIMRDSVHVNIELYWYENGKQHRDHQLPAFVSTGRTGASRSVDVRWFLRGVRAQFRKKGCDFHELRHLSWDVVYLDLRRLDSPWPRPILQAVIDNANAEIQRFAAF